MCRRLPHFRTANLCWVWLICAKNVFGGTRLCRRIIVEGKKELLNGALINHSLLWRAMLVVGLRFDRCFVRLRLLAEKLRFLRYDCRFVLIILSSWFCMLGTKHHLFIQDLFVYGQGIHLLLGTIIHCTCGFLRAFTHRRRKFSIFLICRFYRIWLITWRFDSILLVRSCLFITHK